VNWLEYAVHEFEGNAWRGAAKRDEGGSIGSIGSPLSGTFENFSGSPIASKAPSHENEKNASGVTAKRDETNPTSLLAVPIPSFEKNSGGSLGEEGVSNVSFGPVTSGISENSKGAISVVALAAGRRPPDVFQNDPPPLAKRDVRDSPALGFQRAPLQPLPIEPLEAAIFSRREGKSGITTPLRSLSADDWTAQDWRAFFGQRRALATRDRRFSRPDAEAPAFNCCVAEWLNRHPIRSSADRCCWCSGMERDDNVLLPFGIDSSGHAWLHSECWNPWREWREREAVEALTQYETAENRPLDRWFIPST
jgi:hypothetical protein